MRYSFGNQLLLAMQRADVTSVATFKAWKKVGRSVKKGEKGLMILTPKPWKREEAQPDGTVKEKRGMYFGTAVVFDISQTDGKELPKPPPICVDVVDEDFEVSVEALREVALSLHTADDKAIVSAVDLRDRRKGDHAQARGWYVPSTREIVIITDKTSRQMQFKTLVHEVAHAIMHGPEEHHAAPVMEVEAESVAFIVCSVLGLSTDSYSFPYVAVWAGRTRAVSASDMVKRSGDRITKAATTILDALLGKVEEPAGDEEAEEAA